MASLSAEECTSRARKRLDGIERMGCQALLHNRAATLTASGGTAPSPSPRRRAAAASAAPGVFLPPRHRRDLPFQSAERRCRPDSAAVLAPRAGRLHTTDAAVHRTALA